MKVAVVTPTISGEHLGVCLDSVKNQTYKDITHYVFIDGKDYYVDVYSKLLYYDNAKSIILEENVGKGWYGHRVYAACSFLVNADVIVYLDEDNWIDPDHIANLVKMFDSTENQWAYSLRKIIDKEGKFLCEDNCESLGKWSTFFDNNIHHIDTSCFAIRKEVAVRIGHAWYGQWGADRQFYAALREHYPIYDCTGKHTLNYRLDGNPNSVKKEFFEQGNTINMQKYNGKFPWKTE